MPNRRLVALLAAAFLLATLSASAQDRITPPEPIDTSRAPYPDGGEGEATVLLELVIGEDGSVKAVSVARGREPFASAARRAAATWRFSPATRRGETIATKIRYEVSFEETISPDPDPDPEPVEPQPDAVTDEPEPAPTSDVIEVAADEVARPPSVSSLRRSEIRRLPGAFGDPFRAIEVLPGVTPIVSGLPFFYVRGAPPGNVGYFLDGVRVPYLFHVAAGPSVIHPALVERVDLYSGGYPARFGRYAGAIVSAETSEPRADWHGEGNIRLVDAGALVEGGFLDGRGRALLAGRYSYTAALFSLLSPEITLDYRDFQGRFSFDITDRDRISVFTFGAYDYLSDTEGDVETVLFGSEFYRVDTRYDARLRSGGKLRAAVTAGFDRTRIADGRNTQSVLVNSRVRLTEPITDTLTLRAGFDMQLDDYRADEQRYVDPDDPDTAAYNNLFPPRSDSAAATWADVVWKLGPLEITPGLRVDGYYSNGAKAVAADPRLAVTARVHERVRLLHALGVAHQPPSFVVPIPGLAVANLRGGLQRALQASSGVEVALPWDTIASVTAFSGVYTNMTDTISLRVEGDPSTQLPRALGGAKGLEVYIRRSLSNRIGGFIAYTFSRTTRSVDEQHRPAAFDRTHVLHTAASFDLTSGWRAGTRVSVISGAPRLLPLGLPPGLPGSRGGGIARDPVFYRVDFRIEKRWSFTETVWLSLVLEMLNATLNTDIIDGNQVGPVTIPSIGVEGGF